jgi:hypothetical protein
MRLRPFFCTIALVAFLAGCGQERRASPPPFDVQHVAQHTSAFQREILTDGHVDYAEYERSVLATVQCLRDGGLFVEGPHPRDRGDDGEFLDFSYGLEETPGQSHEDVDRMINDVSKRCEREYRTDVDRVWAHQHVLTPQQREQSRQGLISCLHEAGARVRNDATDEAVLEAIADNADSEAVRSCRDKYAGFFLRDVH